MKIGKNEKQIKDLTMILKRCSMGFVFLILFLAWGCKPKMPSTYEVHYSKDLKDSVAFVNYNLTADSSCNFYMGYKLFFSMFEENNFEPVYQYYLKHNEIKLSQEDYKMYKPKWFYSNHGNDTIEYYSAGHKAEPDNEKNYLKPSVPYQPTRTYNPIRTK